MPTQLYRFQLHREPSPGIWAGVDEADGSSVWFVQVPLDLARREEQFAFLRRTAWVGGYEDFSAGANFYIVAPSEQKAKDLVATLTVAGLLTRRDAVPPANEVKNGTQKGEVKGSTQIVPPPRPDGPKSFHPMRWIVFLAVILVVAFLVGTSLGWWSSTVAAPVLSPAPGSFTSPPAVTLSDATAGAVIHYTVDGSQPTESSAIYGQPLRNLRNGTAVRAIATAAGANPSPEVDGTYRWTTPSAPQKPAPVTAYEAGTYAFNHGNDPLARKQFARSCDGGIDPACEYLAYLYAKGRGGPQDIPRAGQIYGAACVKGNLKSCSSLAALYKDAGQLADARRYFQKACDGHFQQACDELRKLQ